jgi:hypothetical protein
MGVSGQIDCRQQAKCVVTVYVCVSVCVCRRCVLWLMYCGMEYVSFFNCVKFYFILWTKLNEYVFYELFTGIGFCRTVTDRWKCEVSKSRSDVLLYSLPGVYLVQPLCYLFSYLRTSKFKLCEFFFEKQNNSL